MKKSILMATALAMVCTACMNVKETPKGLQFKLLRSGTGPLAEPNEFLVLNLRFTDGNDSVWSKTPPGEPMFMMVGDTTQIRQEQGLEEIWRMLSKGDSIEVKIPAQTLFAVTFHQPLPKKIDPKANFTFNIGVTDVMKREEAQKLNDQLEAKRFERFNREQKAQLAKDVQRIDRYLDSLKIETVKDSTGLRYHLTKEGKGNKPTLADLVAVKYVGKLLQTGEIFDQSNRPVDFKLGQLIRGWQVAFPLLNEGSVATLFIPSTMAYGPNGSPPRIPGNSCLVFEVELAKVKKETKK